MTKNKRKCCKEGDREDNNANTYGLIGKLPSINTIKRRINKRFDQTLHEKSNGEKCPYVCTICDEMLLHRNDVNFLCIETLKKHKEKFMWEKCLKEHERLPAVEEYYSFKLDNNTSREDYGWMNGMALSPRGVIGKKSNQKDSRCGVSCCSNCKNKVIKGELPLYAIINPELCWCCSRMFDFVDISRASFIESSKRVWLLFFL